MTHIDRERVLIFRRSLENNNNELQHKNDEVLLEILNMAVLPNSISKNVFKYTVFIQLIINKTTTVKLFKLLENSSSVFNKIEKSLLKYAIYRGFKSSNSSYEYHNYIYTPIENNKPNLIKPKEVSFSFFDSLYHFFYSFFLSAEKNKRFPTI